MSSFPQFLNSKVDFSPESVGLGRSHAVRPHGLPESQASVASVDGGGKPAAPSFVAHDEPVADEALSPIYFGGVRLLDYGKTARAGSTVRFMLRDVGPRECHPFKGLEWRGENAQRMRTWVGPYREALELVDIADVDALYKGESRLTYYGDTCREPNAIKVELDSIDNAKGVGPFEDMPYGLVEGQDLMAAFWAIDDDETLLSSKKLRRRTPFSQSSETKQANIVSGDPEFVNFLFARRSRLIGDLTIPIPVEESPRKWANEFVRLYLGVATRSVLNDQSLEGVEARKRWKLLVDEYHASEEFSPRRGGFSNRWGSSP